MDPLEALEIAMQRTDWNLRQHKRRAKKGPNHDEQISHEIELLLALQNARDLIAGLNKN